MTHTHTLSNGLRIIHRSFPSDISYCGIAVNSGTRDEFPAEQGMAHFVEHMLFKGTEKRRAHHVVDRMENIGGELNAYTSKEETFVYAAFPEEYLPRTMELLNDIVFHSRFSDRQIEREREVIIDEILSYEDSPSELIYDDFENLVFAGHDLGHYILGDPETLQSFNSGNMKRFVERQYRPDNMVFFSFGKTSFSKVIRMAEKYFSSASNPSNEALPLKQRISPAILVPEKTEMQKDTSQSHVVMGWRTFNMYHPDKYVLYMINHILGGGSLNSRLNVSLREKHGLVYHVESNLTLYSDTGLFTIYFASDPKFRERCLRLINKEIEKIMQTELTPTQLMRTKRQWKGQMGIAAENHENNTLGMGKAFLHFNRYTPLNEVYSRIDGITQQEIKRVANEIFSTSPFQLSYV
ncbi:putative Zn-dependent peptidase [Proteiniphilum saccharofermentans]|uniref:Putative Zn-dependent peptidase n=1 Tax=Proteiniphilum saccharofermentans TaxID=1642647 RepID=A0A1R3T0X4_9BACT|nr:pitrilysin family protein [Proteiniphilum saccharofermentans]SCD20800.1 putative Zn-dependent peptidase [Proteiniphilum saccharofermentans]